MSADAVELYIWYRVPAARLAEIAAAAEAMQAQLQRRAPGLELTVRRRPDAGDGLLTLMEIWRHPGGIDAALEQAIADAAAPLAGFGAGPRQVERFVPLSR